MRTAKKIPLWFSCVYGFFVLFFYITVLIHQESVHFFWFSRLFLLLGFLASVCNSSFLASMLFTGGLLPIVAWNVDFACNLLSLITTGHAAGFTAYVFDPATDTWLRMLTLYHVALLPIFFWLIARLGYHSRAWIAQTALMWGAILVTYFATPSHAMINLAHGYRLIGLHPTLYLLIYCAAIAGMVFATHKIANTLAKRSHS